MVTMARKENPLYIPSKFIKKLGMNPRNEVSESKAKEFFEKMKYLKVEIIRKLEEAPVQVSLLNLVLASKKHRRVLLKVLGETYLPKTVSVDHFEQIVRHILVSNAIAFTDDNILKERTGHRLPLHIAEISPRYLLGGVLIDG